MYAWTMVIITCHINGCMHGQWFVCLFRIFNVALTIFQSYRYDVCCEAVYSDV
jgi:hypothetical protein